MQEICTFLKVCHGKISYFWQLVADFTDFQRNNISISANKIAHLKISASGKAYISMVYSIFC